MLAFVGRDDWILCQITSKSYADSHAIEISDSDFSKGSLQLVSYARPGKLFTAHTDLFRREIGCLKKSSLDEIIGAVVSLLKSS